MRFVAGKYSPGHDWAAMLGFVIDGDHVGSTRLVSDYVGWTRRKTNMEGDWAPDRDCGLHEKLYRTCHRQGGRISRITILNLFLPMN